MDIRYAEALKAGYTGSEELFLLQLGEGGTGSGDVPGHEFHGNQYSGGGGGDSNLSNSEREQAMQGMQHNLGMDSLKITHLGGQSSAEGFSKNSINQIKSDLLAKGFKTQNEHDSGRQLDHGLYSKGSWYVDVQRQASFRDMPDAPSAYVHIHYDPSNVYNKKEQFIHAIKAGYKGDYLQFLTELEKEAQ